MPHTPLSNLANFLLPAKKIPIISLRWLCSGEDELTNGFVSKGSAALIAYSEVYAAVLYAPLPYSNVYPISLTGYAGTNTPPMLKQGTQKRDEPLQLALPMTPFNIYKS
jgi:hypothetical protein